MLSQQGGAAGGASPSRLMGEVAVKHSFSPAARELPVLATHVAVLGAMHREWCLRTAKELARGFGK